MGAPRKRGLPGKQARSARDAGGHARQGSSKHGRWAAGLTRRDGLTFELWQQKGRRKAALPSSIVRKRPKFPHGLAPGPLAVCAGVS